MDSVQYILIILYRKLSQKCTYGNFYHCFLHHLIHLLYLVKGRLTLAGYSGFNVNILITFQAVKDLYAHPTCLRFELFSKYFGDFWVYLAINSFSQTISKIYENTKFGSPPLTSLWPVRIGVCTWNIYVKSFDNSHTAVIREAEDIEPLSKRLMSFTVNREVTTASAMLQSCMLVLSDETTKYKQLTMIVKHP